MYAKAGLAATAVVVEQPRVRVSGHFGEVQNHSGDGDRILKVLTITTSPFFPPGQAIGQNIPARWWWA